MASNDKGRNSIYKVGTIIDEGRAEWNRACARRRCSVAAEPIDPNTMSDEGFEMVPKSDVERKHILKGINSNMILSSLPEEAKAKMIDHMMRRPTGANENIIVEGEDADNFYVIKSGAFDVYQTQSGKQNLIASYKQEGVFGELALMYNTPRAATVVSKTKGELYYIDRKMFRHFVLKLAHKKRKSYEKFLNSVPLLSNLSSQDRVKLSDALVEMMFEDEERIISQGEVGMEMFFIVDGKVRIVRTEEEKEIELKVLNPGDFFGELALVTKQPRAAAAFSVGKSCLVALNVQSFERLLGPCELILKQRIERYGTELMELKKSSEQ